MEYFQRDPATTEVPPDMPPPTPKRKIAMNDASQRETRVDVLCSHVYALYGGWLVGKKNRGTPILLLQHSSKNNSSKECRKRFAALGPFKGWWTISCLQTLRAANC